MNDYTGKVLFNNWKLPEKAYPLGSGSFGEVYRLEPCIEGIEPTALKIISIPHSESEYRMALNRMGSSEEEVQQEYRSSLDALINEVKMMISVNGFTNVVGCLAFKVEEHTDCFGWDVLIQMELLESLDTYFRRKGYITNHDVIQLGIDVCTALDICEAKNIIHRDIKPENIMLKEVNGKAYYKLGDFGVARILSKAGTMTAAGTPEYMAPELLLGRSGDHRVDIYSLGLVLYRLLNANRPPFVPDYPAEVTNEASIAARNRVFIGEAKPEPIYTRGTELAGIVLKACEHDKDARYVNAAEMREALQRVQAQSASAKILVVPPCGEYIPSELHFILRIKGNRETLPADGKVHSISGFTTNVREHGISVSLKEKCVAQAKGKAPGIYPMGLSKESFEIQVKEHALILDDVIVEDGALELTKAHKGKSTVKTKPKDKKKWTKKLGIFLACVLLAAVAICVVGLLSSGTSSLPNVSEEFLKINSDGSVGIKYGAKPPKVVEIPTQIHGHTVTSIANQGFYTQERITAVTIPERVSSIGGYAFSDCAKLITINIPAAVTTIGGYAFKGCVSLKELQLPDSVTDLGTNMFMNCTALEKLGLPQNLTTIPDGFAENAKALKEITFPTGLREIGYGAFYDTGFTSLELPEGLETIGYSAFSRTEIESLQLPLSVKSVGDLAFSDSKNLKTLYLLNANAEIRSTAFSGCDALESVFFAGTEEEWIALGITVPYSCTVVFEYSFEDDALKEESDPSGEAISMEDELAS